MAELGFQQLMGNGWYDSLSGDLLGTVDPSKQAHNNFYAGKSTGMASAGQYPGAETLMNTYQTPGAPAGSPGGGSSVWGGTGGGAGGAVAGKNGSPYAMPGGPGLGGGAAPATGGSLSGPNPYLSQMGDVMAGQMTNNFRTQVAPQIASGAMAAGGFGGSRQGVIEANAMNDLNGQIGGALTNLYGQGYQSDRNYDLGLRANDLGFAGLDAQINQNNFNNNMAGANFGLGVWNQGMQNNQTGITAGTNIQNTPQNYWSQFANQYNGIGQGYGSTTGSSSQQGNPFMGALGGAQLGSRVGQMWGGGGGSFKPDAMGQAIGGQDNYWM